MKAIVTVVGKDQVGIIAGVCNAVVANYLNNVGKGKKILSRAISP